MSALAAQTYRGASLDELLPKIREELGSDAVIVRQREGIVGGFGGFFGKKCVEIEAVPAPIQFPTMPARSVVDAYDTGDPADFDAELALDDNPLLETLLAQTTPFSEQLDALLEPSVETLPTPAPVADLVVHATARRPDERIAVLGELAAAGVPAEIADEVVDEVDFALRPFEPEASFRELARRALARRIPVAHGWKTARRTIAVVGLPGAGRTATTARLCAAYAATGRSVGALSLEPGRTSLRLAELTQGLDVELAIADAAEGVARAKRDLGNCDVIVIDTPPIANRFDGAVLRKTAALLEAAKPGETHLLLPIDTDPVLARRFVTTMSKSVRVTRLLLTGADSANGTGIGVGLSLATNTPVSFLGSDGGLSPSEPETLARMVLA